VIDDINGPSMEGIGYFNFTVKDGKRISVATAYLHPAMDRPNLTVLTNAETLALTFDGKRCTGVKFAPKARRRRQSRARKQCCAAVRSVLPRTLLFSGIGPAAELRKLGHSRARGFARRW
jgi:choline dehydrogenase